MSRFHMRSLMITLVIALLAPQHALAHQEANPQTSFIGGSLGDVSFTNPDLLMESGGARLIWHKEAQSSDSEACTRPEPKWGGEGYVKTQWRKLNPDLTPYVGALWSDISTFGPTYTSCSGGRWFAEDYRSLGTGTRNNWWPYWEIRHVKPSEAALQSPSTVYMHAQTTRIDFPCHPTNLRQTTYVNNSVELEWEDCTPDEDHYEILRSTSTSTGWTVIGTAPENATSFVDSSVNPSAFNFYRVRPVDESGSSYVVSRTLPVKGALVDVTAFNSNPDSFGLVEFPDPNLRLSDDGTKLLWTKEAVAPTCSWSYWDTNNIDDVDYVHMQVRKLDENGLAAGNWSSVGPFSPNYTGCQWGQWIESYSRNLGPSDRNWPFWEVRYVRPVDATSQNPSKVYLLARSTASGIGSSLSQQRQCQSADVAIKTCVAQGDPVNSITGAFETSVTDLRLPGIDIPFTFARSYSSSDLRDGPLGRGWQHSLEIGLSIKSNGTVVMRGETGQLLRFAKKPDGTFVSDSGGLTTLTIVPGGYKATHQDQRTYLFDSTGRLTSLTGPNGHGLTVSHGSDGLPNQVTDSVGRTINLTHDADGHLQRVTLPDGRHVDYDYTNGLLSSVTDVRAYVTTYEYDSAKRLTRITDQNTNNLITNTYNADGRVTEQVDARGNPTSFSWNSSTQTSTMTDARDNVWKDVYSYNRLIERIDPLNNSYKFAYDSDNNLIKITDPRNNETTMTYDARGNMITRTSPSPLAYQESFTYDSENNLTSYSNGRGNTTHFDYDAAGNLEEIRQPGSVTTDIDRDSATGLVTAVTDPRGKVTRFDYDSAGNLIKLTSPSGGVATMAHDSSGRMISMVEPRGNVGGANPEEYKTTFAYDAANHLASHTDSLANQTTWSYDSAGNLISRTDAKNRTISYGHNAANLLTSVIAPDNTVTTYAYDATRNLTSRTDANNHTTTYTYDAANRPASVSSPTSQRWTFDYDSVGNVTKVVDAPGNSTPEAGDGTTNYGYDEFNRLVSINYSDSTPDVSFAYDQNSNRTFMTDGAGTETYEYDALDRLIEVARGPDVFSYAYDLGSNLTRRTYPDGTVIDYSYDDDARLASAGSGADTTTYGYDAAGNLTNTTLPAGNGYEETRSYDRAGRLTEVQNIKGQTTLSSASYTLDTVGNPMTLTTTDGITTYGYDALDRLTEACFAAACPAPNDPFIRYTYDPVGNRLTETRPTGTTTYSYNAADQLDSTSGASGTTNYAHDENGNMTEAGSRTFVYDAANRLESTTSGATTISYSYDGYGKRLRASSGPLSSDKINYLWDPNFGLSQLAMERDGDNDLVRRYVHGNDLISMTTGGSSYYYHYDGLGSVTNLTSSSGATQWSYSYEPFGPIGTETRDDPQAPTNVLRFTGELLDSETGLYHLRARQFDPSIGRFTASDPLPAGPSDPYVSTYAYVNNRPTLFIDPSGLFCVLGANAHDGSCRGSGVLGGIGGVMWGVGDAANNALGATIGGIADVTGGSPKRCGDATCVEGSWLVPPGADAWTVGHTIMGKGDVSGCLLQHELTHVQQYELSGGFFIPIYAWETAFNGTGSDNVYEMEAYSVGQMCRDDQILGQNSK